MEEKIAEMIQMLDKADELFKSMDNGREEARKLWGSGMERLAAAIWICERKEDDEESA